MSPVASNIRPGYSAASEQGRGVNIGDAERMVSGLAGGALALAGVRELHRPAGIALALIGGGLLYRGLSGHCQLYQALGMSTSRGSQTGVPARHGSRVEKSIVIDAPPEALYQLWRNFENLPRFVDHIESIETLAGTRSHWVAIGPLGVRGEWTAEIVNDVPNHLIAWRSLPGSAVDTAGSVRFEAGPTGASTMLRVELKYDPPGGKAGIMLAHLLGATPDIQLESDLRRLRRLVRAGELPTEGGRAATGVQGRLVAKAERAAARNSYDEIEQASDHSFPASDPPGWTSTTATTEKPAAEQT